MILLPPAESSLVTGEQRLLLLLSILYVPVLSSEFATLSAPGQPLAAFGNLLFLLADGVIERFLREDAPRLVTGLHRRTKNEIVSVRGRVRGRLDWAATHKAQANPASSNTYICRIRCSDYDQPENQFFAYLLDATERSVRQVDEELCALNFGNVSVAARVNRLHGELSNLRRKMPPRGEISIPTRIEDCHESAARRSKQPIYAQLPGVYQQYCSFVLAPDRSIWASTLQSTPLLTDNLLRVLRRSPRLPPVGAL